MATASTNARARGNNLAMNEGLAPGGHKRQHTHMRSAHLSGNSSKNLPAIMMALMTMVMGSRWI